MLILEYQFLCELKSFGLDGKIIRLELFLFAGVEIPIYHLFPFLLVEVKNI